MTTVIAITSGQGGVGKTNIAINLGLALCARQLNVCLFDVDTGLANINKLLGISPQQSLEQVLSGEKSISEITQALSSGISMVPASSSNSICTNLNSHELRRLTQSLLELENSYDHIIIDTATGVDSNVLEFTASSQYKIIVITTEPTSLTDSFALIKLLAVRGAAQSIYILVNLVKDYASSQKIYNRFHNAVKKYFNIEVHYLGYLVQDDYLDQSVTKHTPVISLFPESPVSSCFFALADIVKSLPLNNHDPHSFSQYWHSLSNNQLSSTDQNHINSYDTYLGTVQKLIRFIENEQIDSQQAIRLMKPILETYICKIHKTSEVLFPAIYSFFAKKDYPENDIKELVFTLETIYEQTHGKPLRSHSHMMARIMADAYGAEDKMKLLHKTLEKSYERQFRQKLYDPVKETVDLICRNDFSKQDFENLMNKFKYAYKQQFNSEYNTENEKIISEIKGLITHFKFN